MLQVSFSFFVYCLDDDEDDDATFCTSDVVCFLLSLCPQSIVGYVMKLLNSKTKMLLGSCK
jgi:hypothetical protein